MHTCMMALRRSFFSLVKQLFNTFEVGLVFSRLVVDDAHLASRGVDAVDKPFQLYLPAVAERVYALYEPFGGEVGKGG